MGWWLFFCHFISWLHTWRHQRLDFGHEYVFLNGLATQQSSENCSLSEAIQLTPCQNTERGDKSMLGTMPQSYTSNPCTACWTLALRVITAAAAPVPRSETLHAEQYEIYAAGGAEGAVTVSPRPSVLIARCLRVLISAVVFVS